MSHLSWEKFWATHNTVIVIASILTFALAGIFIAFAYNYNSYADSLSQNSAYNFNLTSTVTTNSTITGTASNEEIKFVKGETIFQIPDVNMPNHSFNVRLSCTIASIGGRLIQNIPISNITVSMEFGPTCWNTLDILSIEVEPVKTVNVHQTWGYLSGYTYTASSPSTMYLWQGEDRGALQVWSGYDWQDSIFQDAGPVKLFVKISAIPQMDWMNGEIPFEWYNETYTRADMYYHPNFNTTVSIPSLFVESTQSVQQQAFQEQTMTIQQQQVEILKALNASQAQTEMQQTIYDYRNRGLTFFVLFFAAVDIAVVIYDHSNDDEKKAKYEKKKAEQENRNEINHLYDGVV